MNQFVQQYQEKVIGTLSGFDRLVLRGSLRAISYTAGMMNFLYDMDVLLKDFDRYVESTTKLLREVLTEQARRMDRPVKYLASNRARKELIAKDIMKQDGITDGLICLLSCVEPCISYAIRRDRKSKRLILERRQRKCLHLYSYWIDPVFGFMSARIQTWFPFPIQLCLNGREWLSRQMDGTGMGYKREENCFIGLDDFQEAQELMDEQLLCDWTEDLKRIGSMVNPVRPEIFHKYPVDYYWSVHQSEWATDLVFRSHGALSQIYPQLVRAGIATFSSGDVMRFLGKKLHGNFAGELVSDYKNRPEGVRVKHRAGANSVKMYDKRGKILRVETTINDPKPFKVFRPVEGNQEGTREWRPMRKGIADLSRRAHVSNASNDRYLNALASLDTDDPMLKIIDPVCKTKLLNGRRERAMRPWSQEDQILLQTINRGEYAINGFRNRDIRPYLFADAVPSDDESRRASARVTRKIRLLRAHGVIRKVKKSHRYVLTKKGQILSSAIMKYQTVTLNQLEKAAA
ncbi:MAG: hypothetical protein QF732_10225 [Nitrospinaceae bacterium]|jgi:hypothetical protein|nr:hypothetical protein [Nitrospinaceae bacterium]|tara:strand:+ start:77 stop:1627 length:1551 start_codon:yes stop_codon:yes gene_type:complete